MNAHRRIHKCILGFIYKWLSHKKIFQNTKIFIVVYNCKNNTHIKKIRFINVFWCTHKYFLFLICVIEIHKYMYLKVFAISIKNIFGCCDIYLQTVEAAHTNCLSVMNFTAFVHGFFETRSTNIFFSTGNYL